MGFSKFFLFYFNVDIALTKKQQKEKKKKKQNGIEIKLRKQHGFVAEKEGQFIKNAKFLVD